MADSAPKEEEAKQTPIPKQTPAPAANPATAPDPDEDDLSDLDDVLDEFAATKLDSKSSASAPAQAPSTSGPGRPPPDEVLLEDEDEFSKQLQAEMEKMLGSGDMQAQLQGILKEMGDLSGEPIPAASTSTSDNASSSSTKDAAKTEASFQETIRKTMERMQESGDQASAAAASSDTDDVLAQMLKEMESGSFGGEGSDEDFSKVLMGMMEQLTNKEILYEPMKELHEKFPKWMEDNKGKLDEGDKKRYEEQMQVCGDIVGRFERKGYSDSNVEDREYIVDKMQKMQAAGSPPPDLVGDMNAAHEMMGEMDGCPTQ
ncbi:Pex19-domain-containing protein [Polyplosphaeria fusca]|uniref:Pex19-domain-containing protein n=1 Tax=Polyplosphaeria fusca TaxID=682080 RepID=A0A9P4RBS4_9PLEO|nr:Pex19-domain-containing protein [Polyplosphaeria fusca]